MKHRIKILLLEHDQNDVGLILHELKKTEMNFISEVAATKEEFEKQLSEFHPDIVLSDYSIPGFDALLAFILTSRISSDIPFILVSGALGEEIAVDLIKNGVTDFVSKEKLKSLPRKITRALKEAELKREKKLAEKELKESEKRLSEAQSIAKIGSWEVDLATGKQFWSDENYNILGYQPNKVEPNRQNFLNAIHPDDLNMVIENMTASEKDFSPFSFSARIKNKDCSIRQVLLNGKYKFDEQGKPIKRIGTLQDVTELKKMEKSLQLVNKELETFIYRASHDLRGPLSSIIGLTNVSKAEIKDPSALKYILMIEASAQKLDSTLISLVQSMTLRDMEVKKEEVDFDELIQGILSQLKFHEGYSKMDFIIENTYGKKYLSNKLVLGSVFQNLIQNAIKYQNYHNGQAYLKIRISKKDSNVEIVFDDNGIGIDEHLQNKIFDMYFRGTASVSGSGLGLYIVKIGIEKLKGSIQFKSSKGTGTRFTILLPDE
jgi:PAS domain S-box-containing protein